ncbi:AT-rich interactive domain-containing protein 5B-like [Pseudonaja textilis]|nr:AT-rich interactive domain-containing protein 5B-like [Pseudonaja textilis]
MKSKKEREEAPKPQDPAEGSSAKEKNQECSLQKSLLDLTAAEAMKLSAEGSPPVAPRVAFLEEDEPLADASLVSPEAMTRSPPLEELQEEPKQELRGVSCFADGLEEEEEEAQAIPFSSFPGLQLPLPSQNEMEDDKIPEMADYIANCTVKVDQLGSEDIHSALKQSPKVMVVQNFDMFKEKDLPSPFNGDPGFGSTPLLYSKGNPGIMSPLAKKKLLSQVSGAALSCGNYPYGSPPPLISKKKFSSKDDLLSGRPGLLSPRPSMDSAVVSRPSVIQHVQSFKPKTVEDRRPTHDAYRHDSLLKKPDSECCDFSKQHLSALAESYALKSEIQDMKERMNERRALHHSHVPGFLADFYASPPLHSLYRRAEHLGSQPCSKYFPRDVYGENAAGFPPHKLQDRRLLSYHPPLHQPENKTSRETPLDDQPTDLSLPKGGHKQTTKTLGAPLLRGSPGGVEEGKSVARFHPLTGQTLSVDGNPKACRVSPMTVSAPKKQGEPLLRACKLPAPRKLDGMVHPVLSHKAMAQGIGAARPLKRSLEDLDKGLLEKKVRAVSPLRLPKEAPSKEQDMEGSKPVHGPPPGGALEGQKFPLSSPIFTSLYPGTLCGGLGSRMPVASYSHPLQYLKNQAALSPLQPFALHSFMVHRQFLTSPGSSQQLYRHLAAASPVGSSYGDLLHNSVYPLAALNPQPAFPPSQLSSVHPSTKL